MIIINIFYDMFQQNYYQVNIKRITNKEITMFKFDPKNVDDIANKIKRIMPESLKTSKEEMQKTLKSGAEGVLQKLDLVSREEYDIQVALLNKCQEKINKLEAKIAEIENKSSQI